MRRRTIEASSNIISSSNNTHENGLVSATKVFPSSSTVPSSTSLPSTLSSLSALPSSVINLNSSTTLTLQPSLLAQPSSSDQVDSSLSLVTEGLFSGQSSVLVDSTNQFTPILGPSTSPSPLVSPSSHLDVTSTSTSVSDQPLVPEETSEGVASSSGYSNDVELMSYIIEVADRAQRWVLHHSATLSSILCHNTTAS